MSLGLGEVSVSWGAAAVLGVNVVLLLLSGVLTLAGAAWACGIPQPGAGGERLAAQETTCTTTVRSRGRSSKSIRTSCCQVPEREAAADQRDLLGGADQRGALVGVRVGVVVEPVVLVVAVDRDQPVEQRAQVGDARRARTPSS